MEEEEEEEVILSIFLISLLSRTKTMLQQSEPGGFLVGEEEASMADCSFLWHEENAPMEEEGEEDSHPSPARRLTGTSQVGSHLFFYLRRLRAQLPTSR